MDLSIRLSTGIVICILFCSPVCSYGKKSEKSEVLNYLSNQSNFLHYSYFRGQPAPSKDLRTLVDRQARWDDSKLGDPSTSGLHLHFEKIDERATPEGRVAARYRVFAEGAPENKIFVLHSWLVDNTFTTDPHDIYVNNQGLLMLHKPKPEQESSMSAADDELDVLAAADSAEPVRFVLAGRDGEIQIFGTVVPHPVVADDQGCRLEVRIAQPDAKTVLVVADGFPAKAKIPLVLESEGSEVVDVMDTDLNGHAMAAVLPYLSGKAKGILKATAEGPACIPSVVLPWGAAAPVPKAP
ncbi:MAG: hypothetical protein ABR991_07745 [Terracidiphilus sp.]|jgi:hypothetical protein